ncbi:MAG: hypothetical protein CFK48_09950, partial [Armatimonadetes bacterium CP1_7O]
YGVALLNRLGDQVVVRAPLLDNLTLFTLDLRNQQAAVQNIVSSKNYQQVLKNLNQHIDQVVSSEQNWNLATKLKHEIPLFNRLQDAFRQAGIVQPTNLPQIKTLLKEASRSDPARGGDVYYLAFDNNAIRNRLYSNFIAPPYEHSPRYNLQLAHQVKRELSHRLDKINGEFLKAFNNLYPSLGISSIFQNQNVLVDRLRQLALAEWNAMLASGNCESRPLRRRRPGTPTDSDGLIIETYAQFAAEPGRRVILFSSDNDFVTRCDGNTNLIGVLVQYPPNLQPEYHVLWEYAARLLYQLAVIYGRIDIETESGDRVYLYGVWHGKTAEDWRQEHLRIGAESADSKVLKSLQQDVAILKAVAQKEA